MTNITDTPPVWARKEQVDDEISLLGNILNSPKEIRAAMEFVAAEDFFRPEHASIFRAFDALREDDVQDITVMEVRTKLVDSGTWPKDQEAEDEFMEILSAVNEWSYTSTNTRYYAKRVKKMAALRKRYNVLGSIYRRCHEGEITEDDLRNELVKLVDENSDNTITFFTLKESTHDYVDTLAANATHHFTSGIGDLDFSIDGVAPGEMCVIAARPGHGKSLLAVQWLDYQSSLGVPSLLISREMQRTAIGARLLQSYAMLEPSMWNEESAEILRAEINQYHATRAPVYIADKCGPIAKVERAIRSAKQRFGVKLVAVDYMQLLSAPRNSRYEEVTEISQRLKNVAVDNDVAMLALCQMNREVESRKEFEPQLSDLRESGQIEQDADIAIFPQWPTKFKAPNTERWMYQIYCLKRRNGKIRTEKVALRFNEDRLRIEG